MAEKYIGDIALELIAGEPLCACTSGISYEQAIGIAKVLFGNDLEGAARKKIEDEKLMQEFFATPMEDHSLEAFDKWVKERA